MTEIVDRREEQSRRAKLKDRERRLGRRPEREDRK
jgi:hypothetical protein